MDILVTGATGNVGSAVLGMLDDTEHNLFTGTSAPRSWPNAIQGVPVDLRAGQGPNRDFDAIFLMRPPQLTDPAPFQQFLDRHDRSTKVVFLSVQGAERRTYLPHAKIEKIICDLGFNHTFVRPSYFMENLLTTLAPELRARQRIYLPAGELSLDWIAIDDVAACAVSALTGKTDVEAIMASSSAALTFAQAIAIANRVAETCFRYEKASVPRYILHERRQGTQWDMIGVSLLLHFLPRSVGEQDPQGDIQRFLHRPPVCLRDWARRHVRELRDLGPRPN